MDEPIRPTGLTYASLSLRSDGDPGMEFSGAALLDRTRPHRRAPEWRGCIDCLV